jgi:hypothetical protein
MLVLQSGRGSDPAEGPEDLHGFVADHLVAACGRVHAVGELPGVDVGTGADAVERRAGVALQNSEEPSVMAPR